LCEGNTGPFLLCHLDFHLVTSHPRQFDKIKGTRGLTLAINIAGHLPLLVICTPIRMGTVLFLTGSIPAGF
jgi:hypothetical protein